MVKRVFLPFTEAAKLRGIAKAGEDRHDTRGSYRE